MRGKKVEERTQIKGFRLTRHLAADIERLHTPIHQENRLDWKWVYRHHLRRSALA